MKKLLSILILSVVCIGSIPAETRSTNQLFGWWVLSDNRKLSTLNNQGKFVPIDKRKMYFSEGNYFFSATYVENEVMRSNGGQYYLFNDETVATFHQDNSGKALGLANTYHIDIKGDSMHFYGFYINPRNLVTSGKSVSTTLQSSLIDEQWIREVPTVTDMSVKEKATSVKWLKKKVDKSPNKKFLATRPGFLRDSALCYGYIPDFKEFYSKSKTAHIGLISDYSIPFIIQPDGRFEVAVPVSQPKRFVLVIDQAIISLYLEPGKTLGLLFDYKDRLLDRSNNQSKTIRFFGPLASKNQAL